MADWLGAVTFFSVLFVMLVGLAGLLIPVYPGLLIIWLAALVYGIVSGFSTLGIVLFVIISLLLVGGEVIDNVTMGAVMRKTGIPWSTILLAMAAGIIATLVNPLLGLVAAPLLTFLMEFRRLKTARLAFESLKGMLTGWGLGVLMRLSVGVVMILLWGLWVWQASP